MKARNWLVLALSLYAVSLTLPAFGSNNQAVRGYVCVISVPGALFFPSWWANPLFLAGCLCLARGAVAGTLVFGTLAMFAAGSFALLPRGPECIQSGYVAWLASMIVLFAAGVDRSLRAQSAPGSPPKPGRPDADGPS